MPLSTYTNYTLPLVLTGYSASNVTAQDQNNKPAASPSVGGFLFLVFSLGWAVGVATGMIGLVWILK
jgi:hypothetical protein